MLRGQLLTRAQAPRAHNLARTRAARADLLAALVPACPHTRPAGQVACSFTVVAAVGLLFLYVVHFNDQQSGQNAHGTATEGGNDWVDL